MGVEALVNAGAKVNSRALDGRMPLHVAAAHDKDAAAEMLLQLGAEIDGKTDEEQRPIHAAALGNAPKVAALLIAKGCDAGAKDKNGKTAKQLAKTVKKSKVMELLP